MIDYGSRPKRQLHLPLAGPAAEVTTLIAVAQARGWTAAVTATTAALDFIDTTQIEKVSGNPVRSTYQATASGKRLLPSADALIIAPATFNTVNKLALGIADTYPLTSIAELIGRHVPTVIVPFVNSALTRRTSFKRSVAVLRDEGVRVVSGLEHGWEPHPPGTGTDKQAIFPWRAAFDLAEQMVG